MVRLLGRALLYSVGGLIGLFLVLAVIDVALPEGLNGDKTIRHTAATATARVPTATSVPAASTPTPRPSSVLSVGSHGQLVMGGYAAVFVAQDLESEDAFQHGLSIGDTLGNQQLLAQGRLFGVPRGTKVLVLGSQLFPPLRHVRVLEGNEVGRDGWVPVEWVLP